MERGWASVLPRLLSSGFSLRGEREKFPAQNGKVFRVEYFYFSAYYVEHFWVISEIFSPGESVEFYPVSFFLSFVGVS